ncbi:hypothetical protein D3C81_1748810 [compost metagenome]
MQTQYRQLGIQVGRQLPHCNRFLQDAPHVFQAFAMALALPHPDRIVMIDQFAFQEYDIQNPA